ncbi:hypothetical protein F5Y18DRAFT_436931 [Xylariaceae sp. FL1019]|nr:hypothetical protein F5Y18DRAFT_436931 [Xylariaceae sp. FL1019]
MTSLEAIFGELGLLQYLNLFVDQGFDSWETILDITESDLDALGVKLGHRRKLQRRIANYRGIAPSTSLVSPTRTSIEDVRNDSNRPEAGRIDTKECQTVAKRKYRRHPKPDENAPERPPSAYVLFSNKMRDDLKGQNLTFTEIAKLVGENWQNLNRDEKEPFERQANEAKERYNRDLSDYKKTAQFSKYNDYLHDFRKRQALHLREKDASKRLKTESGSPRGSSTSGASIGPGGTTSGTGSGSESQTGSEPPPTRQQRFSSVPSLPNGVSNGTSHTDEPMTSPSLNGIMEGRHRGLSNPHTRESILPSSQPSIYNWQDGQHMAIDPPESLSSESRPPLAANPQSPENGAISSMSLRRGSPRIGSTASSRSHHPPSLTKDESSAGSMSSLSSSYLPRTPSDASLPIHALLSSKPPELPAYISATPGLMSSSIPSALSSQPSRLAGNFDSYQPGANGYPPVPPHTSAINEPMYGVQHELKSAPKHRKPPMGTNEHSLDGISALLRAREIVDRRL